MFKTSSIAAVLFALAGTAATIATPAYAKDVVVHYADLDLATAGGQERLIKRVDVAARKACEYDNFSAGARLRDPQTSACYRKALAQGREQVAALTSAAADATRLASKD